MDSHKNWKLKHKQPSLFYKIKHRLLRFVHCVVPWSPVNSLIRGPQSHLRVKEHQSLFTWLHLIWTVVVEMNSTQKRKQKADGAFQIKGMWVCVAAARLRIRITSVEEELRSLQFTVLSQSPPFALPECVTISINRVLPALQCML